ncbi:unnamed protein product [Cylindrotheca closterium]|uniref:Uncharacterized protein n=1 Tax=Cylindrotheca closterium TaxID=2856 RepID=A0AAD2CYV9_9STRA|nr:unnamed protein product [Cylindrotheca closterium]
MTSLLRRNKTNTSTSTTKSPTPYPQKRDDIPLEIISDEGSVEDKPMDERIEDRRTEMMLCNVTEDIGANLAENNLCDYTMTTVGQICGMTPKSKEEKPTGPRSIPDAAFRTGADEHTSIEVEYVEPRLRKPISKKVAQETAPPLSEDTTKRKLLLQNLNDKAREDYKKEVRTSPQEFPDDEYAQNTIYNSFSQPEKRKFIKLISLNVTPTDAANQVLRERREGLEASQEQAKSPSKKKGLAKFFSKKKVTDEPEEEPEIEKPEFSNSGINYYDAVRKVDAEGYKEPVEEDPAADAKKTKKKKSILPSFKKKRFVKVSGVEPKNAKSTPAAPAASDNNNRALAAGAAVAGAAAVGAAAVASGSNDEEEDSEENPEDENWMPPPPPPGATSRGVMTEEEVLRDLAMADTGDIREEKKLEDDMAAQLLGPMSANQANKTQINDENQELDDIDTYLKSTESSYGGVSLNPGNVPDHMTVGSYKTAATNATTSTRARRPGQAQKRMQQQKAAEIQRTRSGNQVRGWQETMQKAAAENNRTWDPQRGWVDYGDPNAPPIPHYTTADELSTPPPAAAAAAAAQVDHRGRGMAAPTGQDPQGWAETMKAASARLLQAGKRWDPDLGWVSTGSPDGKAVPRQDDGNVNTQDASDTADFGGTGLLEGEGQDEKLMIYEDENSESESNKMRAPSPLVQVKKEKVDDEDAEYFKSPRGGGPVDLDDEVEDDKQEQAPKSTKGIPKLKGPKRDTSPVRGRRSAGNTPEGNEEDNRKSSEWKTFLARKQAAEADRQDQDKQSEVASEASTAAMQGPNTFMGRLQACAAPILPTNRAMNGTSPQSGSRLAALCGRPDMIHEEIDGESITTENTPKEVRDRSRSRTRSSKSDVSSVISDEMSGSKAAFLESMAMKAVVSSKGKRRSPGSDAGSSASYGQRSSASYGQRSSLGASPSSTAGSASSTKWQQFLEKKKAENGGGSVVGARSQASTSISRAAEKYAAKKAEEMMETQNSTPTGGSSFKPRPMEESTGAFPKPARIVTSPETPSSERPQMLPFDTPKSSSQIAAEEARAARLSVTTSTPTRSRAHLPFEPQKSEAQKAIEEAKAKRMNSLRASLSSPRD